MESNSNRHTDSGKVDAKKFQRLALRIYALERENFKTKKLTSADVDKKVRTLIEFEVDKNGD